MSNETENCVAEAYKIHFVDMGFLVVTVDFIGIYGLCNLFVFTFCLSTKFVLFCCYVVFFGCVKYAQVIKCVYWIICGGFHQYDRD